MIRLLRFLFFIAVLGTVAFWLADRPGTAQIVWRDTVIETSAAFLALCVLLVAYALHLLLSLWHFLSHGPTYWRLNRKISKLQLGQSQLTRGIVALASGDSAEAGKLAVAARRNMSDNIASKWLQARAARLAGNHRMAQEIFRDLATDESAAVLGYRGLVAEAKREGKWDDVDRLLAELHRIKPAAPWLSLMRMESAARRRHWEEAEKALARAVETRLLDSSDGRHMRAALRIAASRNAASIGDNNAALQAAEQSAKLAPDWLPAIINLAETLAATGHRRAALRAIERAWKNAPHPKLARIVLNQAETPLDGFKQTERLCRNQESAPESRLALAEAALAADIWGEARRNLLALVNERRATQNVYRLLARLERLEHGNERAATSWLSRAAEAAPDPTWQCRACGHAHNDWQPLCLACESFNTLGWQRDGKNRTASFPQRGPLNDD